MAKKRGNPNWGKPDMNVGPYTGATSFEEIVKKLQLAPNEYVNSPQLRDWVQRNKDQKYVPSNLLQAWNMVVRGDA